MARARWKRQTRGKSPDQFTAFFVGPGRAEFALEGNGCGSSGGYAAVPIPHVDVGPLCRGGTHKEELLILHLPSARLVMLRTMDGTAGPPVGEGAGLTSRRGGDVFNTTDLTRPLRTDIKADNRGGTQKNYEKIQRLHLEGKRQIQLHHQPAPTCRKN